MKKVLLASVLLVSGMGTAIAANDSVNSAYQNFKGNNYDRSVYGNNYTPNPKWQNSQPIDTYYSQSRNPTNQRAVPIYDKNDSVNYYTRNYDKPSYQSDWRNDIYIGANVGHSHLRHFSGSNLGSGISADNGDTSYGLYTGYQFHKNFAAELGYNKIGEYSTSDGDYKLDTWNLSLVGKQNFTPRLAGTARLGVAFTDGRYQGDSNHKTTPVYGLGLEYAVNKNVALTTNWDRYQNFANTNSKLDNYSVGLKYTF